MALTNQALILVFLFLLGATLGSFFNVCIYRLPADQSIVRPGSRCPKCEHPIAWYDNIPLLSYVLLRGRCRHCRTEISIRYPIVEMLTALLFAVTGHMMLMRGETLGAVVIYLALLGALIVLSFIDLDHQILPDEITLPGLALGVVLSGLGPGLQHFPAGGRYALSLCANLRLNALANSALGAGVGAGMIYLTGKIGKLVFRKEAMGFGDVKMMGMIGGFLGVWFAVLIFFLAPLFGLVFGVAILLGKGEHHIPYGPFLSMATLVMLLWGPQIFRWASTRFHPVAQLLG